VTGEREMAQAGLLQEHKEIRSEIRQYLDWRSKSIQFSMALTTGAVALGPKIGTGLLFLLTALVVAFLWYDEVRHLIAVFRLATYLELFVEPNVPGLEWETIGGRHPIQTDATERAVANGIFPTMFIVHATLMVRYSDWLPWQDRLAVAGLALVFIAVATKSYSVFKHGRQRERDTWRRVSDATAQRQS